MTRKRRSLLAGALVASLLAGRASAEPIAHEYVAPPGQAGPPSWPREGKLPEYLQLEDTRLPRPEASAPSSPGQPIHGAGDRSTQARPDRTTTHDGTLRYPEEFNPSVVPFKRVAAFDRVEADDRLRVADPRLHPLPLARRPTPPDREAFWGHVLLRARRGEAVPLPSVSAEAQIVSYQASPPSVVQFFRDGADNLWARADHDGLLKLVFVTDAPRHYFAPELPLGVTAAQVPSTLRPSLPAQVAKRAARVLKHLGVSASAPLAEQLDRLVAYFRNFTPGPLPRLTGDTYLDLALSQKGVCRHRSFAFVVTTQALGIPARYVQNEAHVFTEVFVPRLGWIRIDLGGASSALEISGADGKVMHRPGPDPFPRPSSYQGGYSQLLGRVTGLSPSQRAAAAAGPRRTSLRSFSRPNGAPSNGAGAAGGAAGSAPGAEGSEAAGSERERKPSAGGADPEAVGAFPGASGAAEPGAPGAPPGRVATQITAHCNLDRAQRGERVRVSGRVLAGGRGAAGLRVEIYLSRDGQSAEAQLGATVTGPDGSYLLEAPVPLSVPAGAYRVFAATPGDTRHAPSLSR
ncbi:MAG: hypothetical protein IT371_13985 [Deltaproteobacteria bacterium]|nr:hypothetical protein [Deltaproteobacteria bacterium]